MLARPQQVTILNMARKKNETDGPRGYGYTKTMCTLYILGYIILR